MTRAMKDSGIEWIGEIPKDWDLMRLQFCLNEIKEKNLPVKSEQVLSLVKDKGVMPYEEKGNVGNVAKEDISEYKLAYPNTLILNSMNILIGSVGISKYFGCVSPVYYVFKETKMSDLRFINYIFTTNEFQKELRKYANGIMEIRLRVSAQDIFKRIIAYPNKQEQIKIADFLDEKCSHIDSVLEKVRASIDEYKQLKQSVITQAVTKGVRPNRPMKDSGIEWIGEIPQDWSISKIKFVAKFNPQYTVQTKENDIVTFAPMECIKNGYYNSKEAVFQSSNNSYTPFQEGDIVIAKVTPCFENGNIAIMENLSSGYGYGSSELFVLRPFNIQTRFLFYYLQNESFKKIGCSTMTGTGGLKRVSPTFVQNYPIPHFNKTEQNDIVNYLDVKCAEIDKLITKKEQLITELETYKKSLIYEYVTGKKEVK